MRTYVAVGHGHILSLEDIQGDGGSYHIAFEEEILYIIRLRLFHTEKKKFDMKFGVLLKSGKFRFLIKKESSRNKMSI